MPHFISFFMLEVLKFPQLAGESEGFFPTVYETKCCSSLSLMKSTGSYNHIPVKEIKICIKEVHVSVDGFHSLKTIFQSELWIQLHYGL